MLARCGRAAHICRANKNCMRNCNENLRENRKNRNCLQNQKVVIRVKVSGAIAIPKASWGCAPALPNRTQVVSLRRAAGNQKFFDPTIFQKCWRGVGEQPTFAKQIVFCNLFSLLQLHFLKLSHSQFDYFMK